MSDETTMPQMLVFVNPRTRQVQPLMLRTVQPNKREAEKHLQLQQVNPVNGSVSQLLNALIYR